MVLESTYSAPLPLLMPVSVFVLLCFELNNWQILEWQLDQLAVRPGMRRMLLNSSTLLSGWRLAWKAVTSGTRVGNVFSRYPDLTTFSPFSGFLSIWLIGRATYINPHIHKYIKRLCLPAFAQRNPQGIFFLWFPPPPKMKGKCSHVWILQEMGSGWQRPGLWPGRPRRLM